MGTIKRSFHSTLKYVVRTSVMNCTQSFHFPTAKGFRRKISVKLVYQYMAIYFNLPPLSSNFHPLQVENCDSNLRLVVDEDHNGKFRQTNNPLEKYFLRNGDAYVTTRGVGTILGERLDFFLGDSGTTKEKRIKFYFPCYNMLSCRS